MPKTHDVIDLFPDSQAYKARQAAKELAKQTVAFMEWSYDIETDRSYLRLKMGDGSCVSFGAPYGVLMPFCKGMVKNANA